MNLEKTDSLASRLRLMLITDRKASRRPFLETVRAALAGGVTAVMLREKDWSTRELYDCACALRALTTKAGALLIVNDRADVAIAVGADGVHLGWRSLPIEKTREIIGPDRVIGVSTHNVEEASAASASGADYITFGPVYETPSKVGLVEATGARGVQAAGRAVSIPIVGLGGLEPGNAAEVRRAGADGVAAIRALMASADPKRAAEAMRAVG